MLANKNEFRADETHGIATMPGNCLHVSSDGHGWRNLYASLATEQSWSATVQPVDHFCLAYCVSGAAHIERRLAGMGQSHAAYLQPRYFGSIPPEVESSWKVNGSPQVMLLYLRRSLINQVVAEVYEGDMSRAEIRPILGEGEPLLEQLALAVLENMRSPYSGGALYVEALAHTLAVHMLFTLGVGLKRQRLQSALRQPISQSAVRRVLDYIENGLDQDLSIATLAAVANYSPHFFARSFKHQLGQSLHQYVLQRRVERAKQLLLASDQAISQIAIATGFSSQSHLTSIFRKTYGVTPAVFRNDGLGV